MGLISDDLSQGDLVSAGLKPVGGGAPSAPAGLAPDQIASCAVWQDPADVALGPITAHGNWNNKGTGLNPTFNIGATIVDGPRRCEMLSPPPNISVKMAWTVTANVPIKTGLSTWFAVVDTADTQGMLGSYTAANFFGVYQAGDASGIDSGMGTPTYEINGVDFPRTNTRDQFNTALQAAMAADGVAIVAVIGADLGVSAISNWTGLGYVLSSPGGDPWQFEGDLYNYAGFSETLSAANVLAVTQYFAAQHGVTL